MRYSEARSTGQRRRAGSGEGGGGADPIGSFYDAETHIATTSGTAHDFTGLPAGLNQIIVAVWDMGCSAGGENVIQLGASGGIEATGYQSEVLRYATVVSNTDGLAFFANSGLGTTGLMQVVRIDGDEWVADTFHAHQTGMSEICQGAGSKALSAELTQLRLTRESGGSGTFDQGWVNLLHAGA